MAPNVAQTIVFWIWKVIQTWFWGDCLLFIVVARCRWPPVVFGNKGNSDLKWQNLSVTQFRSGQVHVERSLYHYLSQDNFTS